MSDGEEVMVEASLFVFVWVGPEVEDGVGELEASEEAAAVDMVERFGRPLGAA